MELFLWCAWECMTHKMPVTPLRLRLPGREGTANAGYARLCCVTLSLITQKCQAQSLHCGAEHRPQKPK